ncbi:GNAT family N-acetyltransferase [Clostridium gasigenes]|uniref:GNAT family N-acetyltransferase n=1 Tax=Clostridium gasigenes TaxID=94869 RepID=UPI00162A5583|nr:GNAT family N-acetyltransferase [Clostridium gasigenes]MBB6623793.1 GNAT family N-acetyltransferase [Clostridium gasigenes]MBU3090128.1 GNAT family N-acetyltransferase [Clostridium gasigenes]
MIIKQTNRANKDLIKQIKKVQSVCKKHDELDGDVFLDNSINFNSDMNNIFVFYKDNRLVSFISLFVPTSKEAEVSAYTLPKYRKKGCFKELLNKVIAEVKKYQVKDLLFVCEPQSVDGIDVVKKLEAEYEFSEYLLGYNCESDNAKVGCISRLELNKCKTEDLDKLIELNKKIFNEDYQQSKTMVVKTFESETREQYVASLNGELIGVVSTNIDDGECSIFGLGILEECRGVGNGKAMVRGLLKQLEEDHIEDIIIEVDSKNEIAYNLYLSCGFEAEMTFGYYRKSI